MTVAELIATLSLKSDKTSFSAGEKLIGTVKKAIAGIIAFKTVNVFKDMINDVSQSADHMSKLSKQVGVAIEPLQQLGYVAGLSGVPLETLAGGLRKLAKNAHDAATGGKTQAEAFQSLGIKLKDSSGTLRPVEDLLGDVAERFKNMPDGTKKTAIAMEILGKSGATMIPMLNEGREGVAKLRKEFVDLGGQISQENASAFEQFNDDQERVKTVLGGLKNQLAIALLPHLQKAATAVLDWVKANREFLAQKIREFADKLVQVLTRIWEIVVKAAKVFREDLWPIIVKVTETFGTMVKAVGGVENAIRLLIAAWITFKGLQMAAFLGGLATKMMAFAAATKGAGAVVTDLGNGVTMSMTKAGGGMAKGVAALVGQAGLVAAAGAAGYAFGTLIDQVFDLSGKLSDFMVKFMGDDAFGQQSEASRNARNVTGQLSQLSDDQLRDQIHAANASGDRKRINQLYQERARRSSAGGKLIDLAVRPINTTGKGGKVTQIGAPQTTVSITMQGGDPKQVEAIVKKATRDSYNEMMQAQLRDAAEATGGAE